MLAIEDAAAMSISKLDLFAGLAPRVLEGVDARCRWQQAAAGQLIIDGSAKVPHGVFVLAEGAVDVEKRDPAGRSVLLAQLNAVTCFGEFAVLRGEPGSANVKTTAPSLIGEMPAGTFMDLLVRHPAVAIRLLQRTVHTIRGLEHEVLAANASEENIIDAMRRHLAFCLL